MSFTIEHTRAKVTFTLNTMDAVLETIRDNDFSIEDVIIQEVKTTDITSIVSNLMKSTEDMESLRIENRKSHNLKKFNSHYMKDDHELPYTFDLNFDIKTEGELAYMRKDEFIDSRCSGTDFKETCLEYGFTDEYLTSLVLVDDNDLGTIADEDLFVSGME